MSTRDLKARVTDIVTCPICLELFDRPKSLPCLHTFCLDCIGSHCRACGPQKEPSCPVCRQQFKVPVNGVQGLVNNFFVADLVEARRITGSSVDVELIEKQGGKCERHTKELVKLFCFDCKLNICMICFAEEHNQHRTKSVENVADEYKKRMDDDLEPIRERTTGTRNEIRRLDVERRRFLAGIDEAAENIVERGGELKQLIDKQVNELMQQVRSLKTETCREIESRKEKIEGELLAFETFSAYCSELKAKGKPCDITRSAFDLHIRATKLLHNDVTQTDYLAPVVTFRPMNIHELLAGGQNLVGVVETETGKTTISTVSTHATSRIISFVTPQLEQCQLKKTNLNKQLEKLLQESSNNAAAKESLLRRLEALGKNEQSLKEKLKTATAREKELHEKLKHAQVMERRLNEHLQLVPKVVHTLPASQPVGGVTSLDDELYVLRSKHDQDCIEVHNITTTTTSSSSSSSSSSCSLLRHLSVPGLQGMADMASCKHYRCLYIADYVGHCIHRVTLIGKVTKWSVNDELCGLSVTIQSTVLVTCDNVPKLLEFTTDGRQLREINLQTDIVHPCHAIQLSIGQFVVCHGGLRDTVNRVCIVDGSGHVTQSYGGPPGSAPVGRLSVPFHLAVDRDGFICVADYYNERVLLLSPTLSYVREIVSSGQLKWKPGRMCVNVERRLLCIAENEWKDSVCTMGRVVVVNI